MKADIVTEHGMELVLVGIKSYDVFTSKGGFAGVIAWNPKRDQHRVYFNTTCSRGSKRWFKSLDDAVNFIRDRRIKKGWHV